MRMDDLTVLGQKMREARKRKDLTQQELFDLGHVSVKQIANIEKGHMNQYLHPADWLQFIFPCPQLFPDVFAVFRKICAKFFDSHSVHTCRSFVPDDLQIYRFEIIFT